MEQENEELIIKPEKINSNISRSSSLPPDLILNIFSF
jgi:hypothetical protein